GVDARHCNRAVLLDVLEPVSFGDADRGTLGDRPFQRGSAERRRDRPVTRRRVGWTRALLRAAEFFRLRRQGAGRSRTGGVAWLCRTDNGVRIDVPGA